MRRLFALLALCILCDAGAATPAVSAGDSHSLALHRDGTLRAWGDDSNGALGIGRSLDALTPAQVAGLANVVSVAAGGSHTLALRSDGTVWAWGRNGEGQLGDGTKTARSVPVQVVGLSGVVEIGAGDVYSIARKSDGTLWSWGANYQGELGVDFHATVVSELPVQVPLTGVVSLSAGVGHVLAITSDGRVWAWGRNDYGQLGDGTTVASTGRFAPTPVSGLASVTAVAAGSMHSLARVSDGSVWAWGYNGELSLGDGTQTSRSLPVPVQGLGAVASIAAGTHSGAVKPDGSVWMWGANGYGQIDGGNFMDRPVPVRIPIDGIASITLGFNHGYFVKTDGSVWALGENDHGKLGDGTTERRTLDPVRVVGLANVSRASAGDTHGVALASDGRVFAWGNDSSGQIGRGIRVFRSSPVVPASATGFIAVSAGAGHSLALHQDGRVFAAGNNEFLQLGDGPDRVSRATFGAVPGLTNVVQVSAGAYHSVARRSDGTVWAFGSGYLGRLGNGSGESTGFPEQVRNLTNVVFVAAGEGHSLAVRGDGTVWAWGENRHGQIGDGTLTPRYEPVQVPGLTNVVEVSGGFDHSLARRADGSVWAWGRNYAGELGDDTTIQRLTPVRVLGLVNATQVSAGNTISAALTSDGGVWTWGTNYDAQLGDGTNEERHVPFRLTNLPDVRAVSAGGAHMLAVRGDGTLFSWGRNDFGQVGDATLASRATPVVVARENGAGSVAGNDWFLDLDPGVPNNIPPERVPVFLVTTASAGADVTANIQFRAQDVGSSGSVYVFALAPAPQVVGALAAKDKRLGVLEKDDKNTSVACVLAQLNASGQLQAVSAANLQAYVSGVLSGQGQAVSILNGAPAANIGGATFFVGYGANPSAMLTNGTNRGVVSVPAQVQCQPQPPQTGWWWNPAEGGRGYSIEVRGNHIFYASYLYDVSGRASWLIATGNTSLDGALFTGDLFSFSGGQTLGGPYPGFPASAIVGTITLAFNDASRGTMIWPGGTMPIERFDIVPNGQNLSPRDNQPESGWWWNPAESGRGYFLEWQGGQLFMAGYMYDDAGNPIWYLATNTTPSSNLQSFNANWWLFANGPALTGPFRQATRINDNVAPVSITFSGPETGIMTLPGGRTSAIRRFRF